MELIAFQNCLSLQDKRCSMGKIALNNMKFYAYHGCFKEEAIVGMHFSVDLIMYTETSKPQKSDDLKDTVDYVFLNKVVKEEMAKPSNLLEHVAQRIIDRVLTEDHLVKEITVSVSKINPPIGGDVSQVTIQLTEQRKI